MKKKKKLNIELIIFLVSFIYLLILGVSLTYNFNFENNYNLLFDADTARVIGDMTNPLADHNRLDVHPLFVLLTQPICLLLTGITQNKILSIIIMSAFTSSISTLFIYKILKLINNTEKVNILVTIIYLISFSNIIYTSGIETYNFASLFLILLFYEFIKIIKEKDLNKNKEKVLIFLGLMTLSFTITNFIVYLIIIFVLWIFKKINIKKSIILIITPLILLVGLSYFQKIVWQNTPTILQTNIRSEKNNYSKTTIDKTNIINVVENDYMNSLISNNPKLKIDYGITFNNLNYRLEFTNSNLFKMILLGLFYLLSLFLVIKNFNKNKEINIAIILALVFNTCLHIIYGNDGTFLYSMHFLYLIILLLGINLSKEQNDKIKIISIIFLSLFTLIELLVNTSIFIKIIVIIKDILNTNYLVANLGLINTILIEIIYILFITFLIFLIVKQIKNKKDNNLKYLKVISIILLIITTFISLESTTPNRFLFIPLKGNAKEVSPKEKTDYLEEDFKNYFSNELKSLNEYKDEYDEFLNKYGNTIINDLNWSDYFYFGVGNRRKLYYKESTLMDLDTNEVIYSFTEKEHVVIPNIYTIIIETKENDFIKIYEDNTGVHFNKNGNDEIIENTENYIELYTFENEKYQNVKKVLYNEILFNIKDSKITPNIIVYKEAWYRDAAIASMVLKQTNNTSLIREWVLSIEDIYDRQNNGVEEADNLGELLYIISTQEEKNYDLISRIEEEAERLASTNPKGYYIYGKTDFGDMNLYQNLWYKLGLESLGREYPYDLSIIEEDSYSSTAWWSDYEVKNKNFQEADYNYPYLVIAARHKLKAGNLTINKNLYPLSWEKNASSAIYENYSSFDNRFNNLKTSPIHSWTASEMLLFLLDETSDLNKNK